MPCWNHHRYLAGWILFLVCLPLSLAAQEFPASIASSDSLFVGEAMLVANDSLPQATILADSLSEASFTPDPKKALWYSVACPGLGQLYNRRYWKLPIVAGGVTAISYAISWNNRYYVAYTKAYSDLIDNDPETNYFNDILPPGSSISGSQLNTTLKNRQLKFRRQRDLCIIGAVGLYLLCMLDAYVDAELFEFDISDDLSVEWGSPSQHYWGIGDMGPSVGVACSFRF